jgi:hypothetical protein
MRHARIMMNKPAKPKDGIEVTLGNHTVTVPMAEVGEGFGARN